MVKKLQEFNFKIDYAEVEAIAAGVPSRSHIAKILWKNNQDKFDDYEQIFIEYLRPGKKAYARRKTEVTLKQGIEAIKEAKGIPILSHPYNFKDYKYLIKKFAEFRGLGIETVYPYKDHNATQELRTLAKEYNLLESGGSDFHGDGKHANLGSLNIPYSVLEKLKLAHNKLFKQQ
jgi:3',5'-nucleoside bisphosphate phosphatase